IFETIDGYTASMTWLNMAWLATIVFLPLPTEMLAQTSSGDAAVRALYIGTLLLSSALLDLLSFVISRSPDVRTGAPLAADPVTTVLLAVALVVAVAVPPIGMWSLLLLLLEAPIRRRLAARRRT